MNLLKDDVDNSAVTGKEMLWLFPALVPLMMLFIAFILQPWGWGLMDDSTILSTGSTVSEKLRNYQLASVFRPTYIMHSAVFYTLFDKHPQLFYLFRWFEILSVIGIWSSAAWRISGRKSSLFLLGAATFSFHYFYDGFFYLSSQETIGLFFLGLTLHCYISFLNLRMGWIAHNPKKAWIYFILGTMSLFISFGAKEPFISAGVAVGISFIFLFLTSSKATKVWSFLIIGALLIVASMAVGFLLMALVKSGYSSTYGLDLEKLLGNMIMWAKKDAFNHLPWVMLAIWCFKTGRKEFNNPTGVKHLERWGLCLGLFLYMGHLSILLPWNTSTYYAMPFGLYFGLLMAIILPVYLDQTSLNKTIMIVLAACFMNVFICQYALNRESGYQYDTSLLKNWTIQNYEKDELYKKVVATNAQEPGEALPRLLNMNHNLQLNKFHWTQNARDTFNGKRIDYYVSSPRFGFTPQEIKDTWRIVFLTESWKVYQHPSLAKAINK